MLLMMTFLILESVAQRNLPESQRVVAVEGVLESEQTPIDLIHFAENILTTSPTWSLHSYFMY